MGFTGNSPLSLLLILCITVLLFGTGKLKNIGKDIGEAYKQFRRAVTDDPEEEKKE